MTTTLRALYGLVPPSQIDPRKTALLLIDFQEEFFRGGLPIPDAALAAQRAVELLLWARSRGITVVHVKNVARTTASPLFAPDSPMTAIVSALAPRPSELLVTKSMGGAFSRTDLDAILRPLGMETLVLAGIMTHLAVDATAQDATVLGYHVIVAADATATRALPGACDGAVIDHVTMQRASLAILADRFADVLPTSRILALALSSS